MGAWGVILSCEKKERGIKKKKSKACPRKNVNCFQLHPGNWVGEDSELSLKRECDGRRAVWMLTTVGSTFSSPCGRSNVVNSVFGSHLCWLQGILLRCYLCDCSSACWKFPIHSLPAGTEELMQGSSGISCSWKNILKHPSGFSFSFDVRSSLPVFLKNKFLALE